MVLTLFAIILFIEYRRPYFFLQDDNRDYYLPYYIHNFRSLLNGSLAQFNFHQFLGIPSLAAGQTGALYPFTYIAVFLSKLFFGHYFAAIDIYVIFHLLVGALGMYHFVRFFDADPRAAFFAGITWPLSSYVFFASNSWIVVSVTAALFPWMLLLGFRLYKNPSRKALFLAIIPKLLLFYAGHIQYFIYSVIFEFVTILVYVITTSEKAKRKISLFAFLRQHIEGYLYVLILSLPLLLPMWYQTTISASRNSKLQFEDFFSDHFPLHQLLLGFFFPFASADENTYAGCRNLLNLSHIGYIAIILVIFGFVWSMRARKKREKLSSVSFSVFTIPALIAFFWATSVIINLVIYIIPILNRFRWPFKLAFYLDFFLIIFASLVLSLIIKRISASPTIKRVLVIGVMILQIANFVFLYAFMSYKDFGEHHGDPIPLEEKYKADLVGGRIISYGFDTWTFTPQNDHAYLTAPTLGFNYATFWGLDAFGGYEPLLPTANAEVSMGLFFTSIIPPDTSLPISYFRDAAVKWYVVSNDKADEFFALYGEEGIVEKFSDENRTIFYDAKASPMVYSESGERKSYEVQRPDANTLELNEDLEQPENIFFSYLYNPFFTAYVNGEEMPITEIDNLHFSISVPAGENHIEIKYQDPYLTIGTCLAGVSIALYAGVQLFIYLRRKRTATPKDVIINEKAEV
jgi:hypothetical protein